MNEKYSADKQELGVLLSFTGSSDDNIQTDTSLKIIKDVFILIMRLARDTGHKNITFYSSYKNRILGDWRWSVSNYDESQLLHNTGCVSILFLYNTLFNSGFTVMHNFFDHSLNVIFD